MIMAHSAEPRHADAASEGEVLEMAVKLEGVATDVENNKDVLSEVKEDLSALRTEQRVSTESILRAIRADGG